MGSIVGPSGDIVGVNKEGMLSAISWRTSELVHVARKKMEAWRFTTDVVGITAASGENALLFIQNDDDERDFEIVGFELSAAAGAQARIYTNPTGGTIISNANPLPGVSNLAVGSNKIFPGLAFGGAAAETQTGGTLFTAIVTASVVGGGETDREVMVLQPGQSVVGTVDIDADGLVAISAVGYFPYELPR